MTEEIAIVFVVFASTAAVILGAFYFAHRNRMVVYEAIKTAIEKTGTADAELVRAITHDKIGPNADLRKGVILVAIAGAFVALAFGIPDGGDEALGPMLGVAAFPGLVGIAYILFHFFAPRETVV